MASPMVGKVEFQNANNKAILIVDPDAVLPLILQSSATPPVKIMEVTKTGSLRLMDGRARVDGQSGQCWLGGNGATGMLFLRNGTAQNVIVLDGVSGNLHVGGNGAKGDLFVYAASVTDNTDGSLASIQLDGGTGNVFLRNAGNDRLVLDAKNGNMHVGGNGAKGDVLVYSENITDNTDGSLASIHLNGQDHGRIVVRRRIDPPEGMLFQMVFMDAIVLDGQTGDITLANADCAEDFEVVDFDEALPGTVMVLEDAARLRRSDRAYDKKVAGIVSGAGNLRPGIVLGRECGTTRRRPIALAGRVNCMVDAQYAPVEVGDLLTTSATPGHAMKVLDERSAFGAVIGKALASLPTGQDLLPVLVALQ